MPIWNAIYLGTGPVIDPTEGNNVAENAGALVGTTFGGPGNALVGNLTQVETFDTNGNGALNQNNANGGSEVFTADIGAGTQTFTFDAVTAYNATITYLDGSTSTVTVVVFQDVTGQTFLAPGLTPAANAPLIAAPIQSVTLNAVTTSSALGLADTRPVVPFVACFVAGTLIRTPQGHVPVERLTVGDMVVTRDGGPQPLTWVGGRRVDGTGVFAPVHVAPGALGNRRALVLSPQHRVLLQGWRAELHFAQAEVLVAVIHLVDGARIKQVPVPEVSYHHIMFDRHHLVWSEGVLTESFHPGDQVMTGDPALWHELLSLFPDLDPGHGAALRKTARPVLRGAEARLCRGGDPGHTMRDWAWAA